MVELAIEMTEQERVNEIRTALLAEVGQIEELDQALDYIPKQVSSTAFVMRFVDSDEIRQATGKLSQVEWVWLADFYCWGYEQQEMQHRMESIILQFKSILRQKPLLDGVLKKKFQVERQGDPRQVRVGQQEAVLQRFRLSTEAQVRG